MNDTMRLRYEKHISEWERKTSTVLGGIFRDQEKRYVEPFHLYGPVYYAGDSWVCVHLIDTGEGLLLIDTGNCGATAMLIHSIWKLGFDPAEIRWVVLSHGHLDHTGGAVFLREMFGAKIYMGAPDCEMFRSQPELSLMQEGTNLADQVFPVDVEIRDGDRMQFGKLNISFRLVPGHTAGCIAMFFDVDGEEGIKRVGYYGGFGFNTLTKEYLTEIGDTDFSMRKTYLESIQSVLDEKVELFLGNHCENNRTLEKRAEMAAHPNEKNPFLNDTEWKTYLSGKTLELQTFIADGN